MRLIFAEEQPPPWLGNIGLSSEKFVIKAELCSNDCRTASNGTKLNMLHFICLNTAKQTKNFAPVLSYRQSNVVVIVIMRVCKQIFPCTALLQFNHHDAFCRRNTLCRSKFVVAIRQ